MEQGARYYRRKVPYFPNDEEFVYHFRSIAISQGCTFYEASIIAGELVYAMRDFIKIEKVQRSCLLE